MAVSDDAAHASRFRDQFNNYLAGLCGGLISATAGYPLDVARRILWFVPVILTVAASSSTSSRGARRYKVELARVRFLFGASPRNIGNGFAFTLGYNVLKSGLVWPVQKNVQDYVKSQNIEGIKGTIISGAVGNVIPGILMNPFNVIKVRFMESAHDKTTMGIVRGILQDEGTKTFLRGIEATILRDVLWGMIYFPVFEALKKRWSSTDVRSNELSLKTLYYQTSTAAAAAATATLLTAAIDGIRLFQMKSVSSGKKHHTFMQGLRLSLIPSQRNFLATLTGVGRVTITTMIGHVTFLQVSNLLSRKDEL